MKAVKFMLVLAVMLSAFTFGAQAQNKKKVMAEAKFSVYLHCDDEKKKAEAVVPTIKGIKDMKASVEEQSLWIKYDPAKVSKEALVAALKKKGYDVKDYKEGEKPAEHNHEHGHDHNHNHNHNHSHEHNHNHNHAH